MGDKIFTVHPIGLHSVVLIDYSSMSLTQRCDVDVWFEISAKKILSELYAHPTLLASDVILYPALALAPNE